MFDSMVGAAVGTSGAGAVGAWARVENAACAQRLAASADMLEARYCADGSAEREQWCLDNWDAVAAEIGAAQNVSHGVASHQLLVAMALRERLPRVAEVFATGAISFRLVSAIVARTRLVCDADAGARIDAAIAAEVAGWGGLSVAKAEKAIDSWVDRFDPGGLRRTETRSRGRYFDITPSADGSGLDAVEGMLYGPDGEALRQRIAAMTAGVCTKDPRTIDQRRSDAMGAWTRGSDRLPCACGDPDCPAATQPAPAATVVVHVIAEEPSLSDATPVQLDGHEPPSVESDKPLPAHTNPAVVIGGGTLPAPLLAAKLATTATIRPLIHPGDDPPEPRYAPSRKLADFVRCRDMTCRFPGCDEPAYRCDLDHTIAYPAGRTCASNLACLCRKHHLLKTYCGWLVRQLPDATLLWTAPSGQTYTTYPGSRIHFPTLCKPTAPVAPSTATPPPATGLMMPRRTHTRNYNRQRSIEAERKLNDAYVAERNKPPPF